MKGVRQSLNSRIVGSSFPKAMALKYVTLVIANESIENSCILCEFKGSFLKIQSQFMPLPYKLQAVF